MDLTRSRFKNNFFKVARANLISQILSLLTIPFLTRLYSPSDFATLALFSSILNLLLSFSTLRFEWSVPNAKSGIQSASLITIGSLSLIIVCLVLCPIIYFLFFYVRSNHGLETLKSFVFLLPVALVGGGLQQLIQAWYVREANLSVVAQSKIIQSIGVTILNLLGGLMRIGSLGLIGSYVASIFLGIGMIFRHARGFRESFFKVSMQDLKVIWLKFWKESLLSTGVTIVNTASFACIPLLLAQYYTSTEIGWYALMYKIAIAPVTLFTAAISQSFWSEAAIMVREDFFALKHLYLKSTKYLAIATVPIIISCLAAPLFIGQLLGKEDWESAGFLLPALIPMLVGQVIFSPLSHLVVHGKQHWQIIWDTIRFFLILFSISISSLSFHNITFTIVSMGTLIFIMYLLLFFLNLKCFEVKHES